ncbi:hypothetical protein ABW19_dt0201849 [Dactylella cylindrospora]|nr:hypothetical protein ABW19_dt0201849 [Dactylella cylindrospora]
MASPRMAPLLPLEVVENILQGSPIRDIKAFVSTCRAWYATAQHLAFETYHILTPHTEAGHNIDRQKAFERNARNVKKLFIQELFPSFTLEKQVDLEESIHRWSKKNVGTIEELCTPDILRSLKEIELWVHVSTLEFGLLAQINPNMDHALSNWIFVLGRLMMRHCNRLKDVKIVFRWKDVSMNKVPWPAIHSNRQVEADKVEAVLLEDDGHLYVPSPNMMGSISTLTLDFVPTAPELVTVSRIWTRYFERALAGVQTLNISEDWLTPCQVAATADVFTVGYSYIAPKQLQNLSIAVCFGSGCYFALSGSHLGKVSECYPNLARIELVLPGPGARESWFYNLSLLLNLKVLEIYAMVLQNDDAGIFLAHGIIDTEAPFGPAVDICDMYWLKMLCRIACKPPKLEVGRLKLGYRHHYRCELVRTDDEELPVKSFKIWKEVDAENDWIDDFPSILERLDDLEYSEIFVPVDLSNYQVSSYPVNYLLKPMKPSRLYHRAPDDTDEEINRKREGWMANFRYY